MGANNEYRKFIETDADHEMPRVIEVPAAPPTLHRRHRPGLDRPYRGVGVEGTRYEEGLTGQTWYYWVILGVAIALLAPAAIGLLLTGDWPLLLVLAPVVGLFLVGIVRSLLAEQRAKRSRQAKWAKRLR